LASSAIKIRDGRPAEADLSRHPEDADPGREAVGGSEAGDGAG